MKTIQISTNKQSYTILLCYIYIYIYINRQIDKHIDRYYIATFTNVTKFDLLRHGLIAIKH